MIWVCFECNCDFSEVCGLVLFIYFVFGDILIFCLEFIFVSCSGCGI